MSEKNTHIMLKQLVADYMRARGWQVETEFKIKLNGDFSQNKYSGPGRSITVDVFATKNSKEYVCEVGRITEEERMDLLNYVFDVADHLQLDFSNPRRSAPNFDEIKSVEYSYTKDGNNVENKTKLFKTHQGFI